MTADVARVMVRYLDQRLDAGNCGGPITGMTTHRMALGQILDDIGAPRAGYEARIAAAVGERVRESCPDFAGLILDGG